MSYILDALRRAEAERQRGAVPGLHDQPGPGTAAAQAGARRPAWPLLAWALLGLLGLALAMAAGWWLRPAPQPAAALPLPPPADAAIAPPMAVPPEPPVLPGAGPAAIPMAATPGAQAMAPPARAPALAPADPLGSAAPRAGSRPPAPAALPRPPAPAPLPGALPSAAPTAAATTPPQPMPAPATAPVRLPSLAELPEAQRREIGPLAVGGAMHADQAALRIVILNGQVFHEGDKAGPDLQVQQIRLKSVVLSHRGQRFELPF